MFFTLQQAKEVHKSQDIASEKQYPKRENHPIPVKGNFSQQEIPNLVLSQKPSQGRYSAGSYRRWQSWNCSQIPSISSEITGCYKFMVLLWNLYHLLQIVKPNFKLIINLCIKIILQCASAFSTKHNLSRNGLGHYQLIALLQP